MVSLREVTADSVRAICRLQVTDAQSQLVAPNSVSIAQAYFQRDTAWFRAIYAGEVPVGFVMLYDNPPEARYFLWRFMIDYQYQGRGFGRRALELVIAHVRTRPSAKELLLSHGRTHISPEGFYMRLGFEHTGEMMHDEYVMRLAL
ncbi:MAG: GNAT family N-acetyltransferase [Bacillota bacterium]